MKQYIDLITTILREGRVKTDRTGTGTKSIFGHQSTYYMKDGFPLLTLKKTYPNGVFEELFWFLKGDTNIRYLNQKKVHIWDNWPYEKYKKYAESLTEPDFSVHIDDPKNNGIRIMTQKEFSDTIVNDEKFAKKWGDLGPVYGKQWVNWGGNSFVTQDEDADGKIKFYEEKESSYNQIQNVIDRLKKVPDCRRLIVSAWNVSEISQMALAPCHVLYQFITEPLTIKEREDLTIDKFGHNNNIFLNNYKTFSDQQTHLTLDKENIPSFRLSLQMYQRSADVFLGVPFNVASYFLLLQMVAQSVNMIPYKFVHSLGDAHLYLNHKEQINEFLHRTHNNEKKEKIDYWDYISNGGNSNEVLGNYYGPELPNLKLNNQINNVFEFSINDIELINYNPLSAIKAEVSV